MRSSSPFRPPSRRGALPAALALLALCIQLLIPAASLATEAKTDARTVVLCTIDGAKTVTVPGGDTQHHGFGGLKCHDCVMASIAAVSPGEALALPIRYAAEKRLAPIDRASRLPGARAPPRPPSTGPPALQTA
jgi:hypothetical protein